MSDPPDVMFIATGVIMECYDRGAADAARMLVDWSLERGVPASELAAWLVEQAAQGRLPGPRAG